MSRLFERLGAGETALGVWIKGGPTWVNTIARAGFDFVRPDMMFSSLDWRELDHIHRTAQAVGLTTWLRVPANPWLGGTESLQVTVDVQRAFSLALGRPFEYEHPEVWRALDGIVEKAEKRNIAVAANMGYDYTTHERMLERVQRMKQHGIRACLMQGADNMLENFARPLLQDIRRAPG